MLEQVKSLVFELMENEDSGHGNDHLIRVYDLAMKFANAEGGNKDIVGIAALLHDVDDYKLVGVENCKKLTNAKTIMSKANVAKEIQEKVLEIIETMGYKKSLAGIRPNTIEGKIVSDADMCDVLGANGILRVATYSSKHNKPFFDKNIWPIEDMDSNKYNRTCSDSAVCHFFEKALRLPNLMLTKAGRQESLKRQQITIDFLKNIFLEENAPEWIEYLEQFLLKLDLKKENLNE